jgi:hypothetical protein
LYCLTRLLCSAEYEKELSGEGRCLFTEGCLYGKSELPRQGCLLTSGGQRWVTNSVSVYRVIIKFVYI